MVSSLLNKIKIYFGIIMYYGNYLIMLEYSLKIIKVCMIFSMNL